MITQTDSSRAKTLELHIQSRVASELKKLSSEADKALSDIHSKISSEETPSSEKSAGDSLRQLSRESVTRDVEGLREKLEKRKKLKAIEDIDNDGALQAARDEVVKCLRGNDRRALDCWKEVQAFKKEVGRVEGEWVEKIVR
jgi:altered-inheritance-of-mitochondria protein 13